MRFVASPSTRVIVKLTPAGERCYTNNSCLRDTLNHNNIYDFTLNDFMCTFGEEDIADVFIDGKVVFKND